MNIHHLVGGVRAFWNSSSGSPTKTSKHKPIRLGDLEGMSSFEDDKDSFHAQLSSIVCWVCYYVVCYIGITKKNIHGSLNKWDKVSFTLKLPSYTVLDTRNNHFNNSTFLRLCIK